jgi:hypothetical protein
MSTIQLIGLAVAIIVLVVLIVTLVVTRGRGGAEVVEPPTSTGSQPAPAAAPTSIFDEKPRDGLADLGKAVETPPPSWDAAAAGAAGAVVAGAVVAAGSAAETAEAPAEAFEPEVVAAELEAPPAAEAVLSAEAAAVLQEPASPEPEPGAVTPPAEEEAIPAVPVEEPSLAEEPLIPVEETVDTAAGVALSEVIVTTNQQKVDLEDPEVRRLLRDLVEYEIELAQQYKDQGQDIDAVLQLTEAEKACNALGLTSKARLIRAMIKELKD